MAGNKYQKGVGDHNVSSANEIGAHNYIHVDFGGTAPLVVVCFLISLIIVMIAWLMVKYGSMVGAAVIGLFILAVLGLSIGGGVVAVCFVIRHISRTKAQLEYDSAQPFRNNILHAGENAIALLEPGHGRNIRVENAQQVQYVHHHQSPVQISEVAESKYIEEPLERMSTILELRKKKYDANGTAD